MSNANAEYKKIVFIDDDVELVDIYNSFLEHKNLSPYLIYFDNARASIDYLKSVDDQDNIPDYILLDLYMPGMDGFQFLKQFDKLSEMKESIEIYVCSSSRNKDDRNKVMNYPFVRAFLEKPLPADFIELLIRDAD